jgi:hypothetical protein
MSTKIYNARRISIARLNSFLGIVRRAVLKRAAWQVGKVEIDRDALKLKFDEKAAHWRKDGQEPPPWLERSLWTQTALDVCEAASAKPERDLAAALDCSLNVWIDGRYAYIIPCGEEYLYEKVRYPKWAEDYSYWNNTDPPDGITWRAWKERSKVWDRVCLGHWNEARLNFSIVDLKPGSSHHSRDEIMRIRVPERYA